MVGIGIQARKVALPAIVIQHLAFNAKAGGMVSGLVDDTAGAVNTLWQRGWTGMFYRLIEIMCQPPVEVIAP